MRPRTQKQPQVKKELCRVLDYVKDGEERSHLAVNITATNRARK